MGLAQPPARSTLADALNIRDWRIYEALALRLITRARALYAEDSVLDIDFNVIGRSGIVNESVPAYVLHLCVHLTRF
jgi:hypothetical protein